MSIPDAKLAPWLKKNLRELTGSGIIERVELYHASEGVNASRLALVRVDDGVDADELAQELWDVCEQDANTRQNGLPQRYLVASFFAEDTAPVAQFPFLVHSGMTALSVSSTEPPTEKGELGQRMRHEETMHRLLVETTTYQVAGMRAELKEERELRGRYEKGYMEMFQTMEALSDRKHERELELRREEAREKRHEELMGLLMTAAPLMLAQFMGGRGMPGVGIARDEGIRGLLKGLGEDEINGVIKALKPEHSMALIELYKAYAEEDKKRHPEPRHPALEGADEALKH